MLDTLNNAWENAQKWERDWHGNCINSFHEEEKQLVYAEKMGLLRQPTPKTPINFNLNGISVLDVGGGAYSLLLKCQNFRGAVCDPLMGDYPKWVIDRYNSISISTYSGKGEELQNYISGVFDEVWMYNVLEHTQVPKEVVKSALSMGRILRIFEWIDTARNSNVGHIHVLSELELNLWLNGEGKVEFLNRGGAVGKAYYGVFKGDHYAVSGSE